jgi:hypothetical protein
LEEYGMSAPMSEMKQTATDHMCRDMKQAGSWTCGCEACREIRALMGMEKLLSVWPLVRAVQDAEEQLESLPDGANKQPLREQYLKLYDRLAQEMSR